MSFTTEVKDELSRKEPECSHCDKACLAALLRIEGTLFYSGPGKYRVELVTDVASVGRLMIKLLHGIYHLKTELTVRRSVLHKTPNYLIALPSQPGLQEALLDLGVLTEQGLELGIPNRLLDKSCCELAFLRGVFLGCGFISNPRGDFHFELSIESEALAEGVEELLRKRGIEARMSQRRNSYTVYLKSGASISAFLALVGAHQCALQMENERVIKSVRNDVNRRVNAELANQAKSAQSSVAQIQAIRTVLTEYTPDQLSPALQEYMRLRVRFPDASLKELGEAANPPLSKSAVYHRVRRVEEMAAQIMAKERSQQNPRS